MKPKRMFKPVKIAMAAAVAAAMAVPLYAAPDSPNPDAPKLRSFEIAFDEADDNHDGRLDASEFVKSQAIYERMRAKAVVTDSVITAKVKAALVKGRDVRAFK